MKQNRRLRLGEDNSKNTGNVGEELATSVLELAGFRVVDLNKTIRRNFKFADLLAERKGMWYAVSVRSRHKYTNDGAVKNCYKLKTDKIAEALEEIRQIMRIDALPAFVAIEFDRETYNAYFGIVSEQTRRNGIGMRENERAKYECLGENRPHHREVEPNEYIRIADIASRSCSGAESPSGDLLRPVSEIASIGITPRPASSVSVGAERWRHLKERCGPETSRLLQMLTDVIATLFPEIDVEWNRKVYVSYNVGKSVWLYVRTYPSSLRLLCRVDAGKFDQAELARRLVVRELDGDESHADKLASGSSVSVRRETASRDKVLLRMKKDFDPHSDGFLQFLKDARSSWAQRDRTSSRSEVPQP